MSCPLKEAAQDAPNQLAIFSHERSLTFSELDQEADALAHSLSLSGIEPGHRIAVFHPIHWRLIALFFAAWRLRAIVCPLNLRLPPEQIPASLSRLSPSLFLTSLKEIHHRAHREHRDAKRAKIGVWGLPTSVFSVCSVVNHFDTIHPAVFLFTSGSTGRPKIACLSMRNLLCSAEAAVSALDLRPEDMWLLSLPLFHVGGIGILMRCILARAAIALNDHAAITHLSYVPTQLYRATPVYKNLRCLLLGGAPIPSFPKRLPIRTTYGLTEMSSMVTVDGFPLAGRELKIASDGEIWVRGECLFQGYWEEGQIVQPGEWFATGDIGQMCPRKGLSILGRKDWQFISGGENIQPEEIEQELSLLSNVIEAVVIPISDPEFGKRPAAVVRTDDPAFDLQKLQRGLREKLPKYKIPIALFILDEIPKNGLKIDRKAIFEIFKSKNL